MINDKNPVTLSLGHVADHLVIKENEFCMNVMSGWLMTL